MNDRVSFKTRQHFVNVGTEENPQWEKLNNPIDRVEIFETRWDKVKRFFRKILHLDKSN